MAQEGTLHQERDDSRLSHESGRLAGRVTGGSDDTQCQISQNSDACMGVRRLVVPAFPKFHQRRRDRGGLWEQHVDDHNDVRRRGGVVLLLCQRQAWPWRRLLAMQGTSSALRIWVDSRSRTAKLIVTRLGFGFGPEWLFRRRLSEIRNIVGEKNAADVLTTAMSMAVMRQKAESIGGHFVHTETSRTLSHVDDREEASLSGYD